MDRPYAAKPVALWARPWSNWAAKQEKMKLEIWTSGPSVDPSEMGNTSESGDGVFGEEGAGVVGAGATGGEGGAKWGVVGDGVVGGGGVVVAKEPGEGGTEVEVEGGGVERGLEVEGDGVEFGGGVF